MNNRLTLEILNLYIKKSYHTKSNNNIKLDMRLGRA